MSIHSPVTAKAATGGSNSTSISDKSEEKEDVKDWTASASPSEKINEKYQVIESLDKGSFGEVSLAKLHEDHAKVQAVSALSPTSSVLSKKKDGGSDKSFVIKKIDRAKANDTLITLEIEAGRMLVQHEAIPKYIEAYYDSDYCYLIFEYFHSVNMYTFLESRNFKPVRESLAKKITKQVLSALTYCHTNKVVHRDIKLENVLYNPKKKVAKLIDFGLCAITTTHCNELCNNWCGSPDYVCPEILLQVPYSGCLSDAWSLGVILYVLLFGQMPFNFKERFKALKSGKSHPELEFIDEKKLPHKVSDAAKDMVQQLLKVDPKQRLSIEDAASHKWLTKRSSNFFQFFGMGKCVDPKSSTRKCSSNTIV